MFVKSALDVHEEWTGGTRSSRKQKKLKAYYGLSSGTDWILAKLQTGAVTFQWLCFKAPDWHQRSWADSCLPQAQTPFETI